jgi:hypothetical protein
MTSIERDSRDASSNVYASAAAHVDVALWGLGGKKVIWILVGIVLLSLVGLLVPTVVLAARNAEGCKCALRKIPPTTGHWHQQDGVWACLPGVGVDCAE